MKSLKLKRIFLLVSLCMIICLSIPLLVACGEEEADLATINIKYQTEHGTLSYYSNKITLGLDDEGKCDLYLDYDISLPTIKNEGDDVILSHWVDNFGNIIYPNNDRYYQNLDAQQELVFKAVFEEAEVLVKTSWEEGDALGIPKTTIKYSSGQITNHENNVGAKFEYEKVKKIDANQNYLTKDDLKLYSDACFITSSNKEMDYITLDDITTETNIVTYTALINTNYYVVETYNIRDEIPKYKRYNEILPYVFEVFYNLDYIVMNSTFPLVKMQSYDTAPNKYLTKTEIQNLPDEYFGFDYSKDYSAVYVACDYIAFEYGNSEYAYIGKGVSKELFGLTYEQLDNYIN